MARLSDVIEDFIKALLKQSQGDLQLQRNEMAEYFECAPSQINYVLATRFSIDRGYHIESRRGGGGFIRITQLDIDQDDYILHLITQGISNSISQQKAYDIVTNIMEQGIINNREAAIIKSAIDDKGISIPSSLRDNIRASILKAVLICILSMQNI